MYIKEAIGVSVGTPIGTTVAGNSAATIANTAGRTLAVLANTDATNALYVSIDGTTPTSTVWNYKLAVGESLSVACGVAIIFKILGGSGGATTNTYTFSEFK